MEYMTAVEFKVRSASTAAASFADILECMRLGMAMAAIIKMMVTTISSSIREKPLRFLGRAVMHPPVAVRKASRGNGRAELQFQLAGLSSGRSGLSNYLRRSLILHRESTNKVT